MMLFKRLTWRVALLALSTIAISQEVGDSTQTEEMTALPTYY